jgi:hypothetical protein
VWCRRDDVLWRRSLDAVILLPTEAEEPVTLPGTGAVVWDLLEEPTTLAELVETLTALYGEAPSVVEHDVATLLAELEDLGAVTQAPDR